MRHTCAVGDLTCGTIANINAILVIVGDQQNSGSRLHQVLQAVRSSSLRINFLFTNNGVRNPHILHSFLSYLLHLSSQLCQQLFTFLLLLHSILPGYRLHVSFGRVQLCNVRDGARSHQVALTPRPSGSLPPRREVLPSGRITSNSLLPEICSFSGKKGALLKRKWFPDRYNPWL